MADTEEEFEKLRQEWHAAEDVYDAAIRDHRQGIEIAFLREKRERLKAAYVAKLKALDETGGSGGRGRGGP